MWKRAAGRQPALKIKSAEPAPPDGAVAAGLAWAANVRQRAARLWDDVQEFRQLAGDPAHPLHGVFEFADLAALSSALEFADQAATALVPAVRVELPDLHTGFSRGR